MALPHLGAMPSGTCSLHVFFLRKGTLKAHWLLTASVLLLLFMGCSEAHGLKINAEEAGKRSEQTNWYRARIVSVTIVNVCSVLL